MLLLPADRAMYDDSQWSAELDVVTSSPPYVTPTGTGGAPIVNFPTIRITFNHELDPFDPVAVFEGTMGGVGLITEVRSGSTNWCRA